MNLLQLIGYVGIPVTLLASLIFGSVVPVQEGTVHAVYRFGQSQDQVLTPGLNFVMPFLTSTKVVDVSTKAVPESFSVLTQDGQLLTVTATANYNLNPVHIPQTVKTILITGDETKDNETIRNVALQPTLLSVVKRVTANYTMTEIIADQAKISNEITQGINEQLKAQSVVVLQSLVITGIVLDKEVQSAIENKAIALQNQERSLIDLKTAETIAKNNELISKSLTAPILQKALIDKWNGNTYVFGLGNTGSSSPIIVQAK